MAGEGLLLALDQETHREHETSQTSGKQTQQPNGQPQNQMEPGLEIHAQPIPLKLPKISNLEGNQGGIHLGNLGVQENIRVLSVLVPNMFHPRQRKTPLNRTHNNGVPTSPRSMETCGNNLQKTQS